MLNIWEEYPILAVVATTGFLLTGIPGAIMLTLIMIYMPEILEKIGLMQLRKQEKKA